MDGFFLILTSLFSEINENFHEKPTKNQLKNEKQFMSKFKPLSHLGNV